MGKRQAIKQREVGNYKACIAGMPASQEWQTIKLGAGEAAISDLTGYAAMRVVMLPSHCTNSIYAMEENRIFNVLFLCTHNSARSIMGEAILNSLAVNGGKFRAFSAGSHPASNPNPLVLEQLRRAGLSVDGLRSKSWNEFAAPGAPRLDFVFTVCDNAANEICPVWPGQPMTAHWGLPDPSLVEGTDAQKRQAFSATLRFLLNRINIFVNLPFGKLDQLSLQDKIDTIGKTK